MAVVSLGQLLDDIGEAPRYAGCDPQLEVDRLEVDSRKITPGCAFLALRGATHDGHAFIPAVEQAGARVVIANAHAAGSATGPHVLVPDTTAAYPQIAANAFGRPARHMALVGITGTNGKTTTAHLVGSILAEAQHKYLRLGTTGNWVADREETASLTTPFPLELQGLLARAVERGATVGVMEASSHALAQGRTQPLKFRAVGFTSFSQDHLDFHADMDAYLTAKCLLASQHLEDGGVAVAAVDAQPAAARFLETAKRVTSRAWRASRGASPEAEILATIDPTPDPTIRATVATPAGSLQLRSPLIGAFNLDNAMVAIGIAIGLGIPLSTISSALAVAGGAPGRLQRIEVPNNPGPTVIVDYAHTPDAVLRALQTVRSVCEGQLHVVLGCGGDRDRRKRPMMGQVASTHADVLWATSDNPRTEDPDQILDDMLASIPAAVSVIRQVDRATAIREAVHQAAPEDLILIAGKGHEDYQIMGTTKTHFDDREHAQAALAERARTARQPPSP